MKTGSLIDQTCLQWQISYFLTIWGLFCYPRVKSPLPPFPFGILQFSTTSYLVIFTKSEPSGTSYVYLFRKALVPFPFSISRSSLPLPDSLAKPPLLSPSLASQLRSPVSSLAALLRAVAPAHPPSCGRFLHFLSVALGESGFLFFIFLCSSILSFVIVWFFF